MILPSCCETSTRHFTVVFVVVLVTVAAKCVAQNAIYASQWQRQ
jgi:hypothetical protein